MPNDHEVAIKRLYEQAKREQWNSSALPWETIDLSPLDGPTRAALAWVTAHVHRGELASLEAASRLIAELPSVPARLMASTQVADEARHVEWFASLQGKLGEDAPIDADFEAFIGRIAQGDTAEERLVGLQVLEVMAHTLFSEMSRRLEGAGGGAGPSLARLGVWLRDLVSRDEARHTAFAQLYLSSTLPRDEAARARAFCKAEGLCAYMVERTLPYLRDEFGVFEGAGRSMIERGAREMGERLRRSGLPSPALP